MKKTKLQLDFDEYFSEKPLKGYKLPYGFKKKEGDPKSLVPIPEIVEKLRKALDYIDQGRSYREAADWLFSETNEELSHVSLRAYWFWFRDRDNNPRSVRNRYKKEKRELKPEKLSREERKRLSYKKKIQYQKATVTNQQKKLQKLVETAPEGAVKKETLKSYITLENLPPEVEEEQEIYFKPHPGPQTEFLAASEREVLYGGAAGGGKSYALLADAMRHFDNPNFRGVLVRKTLDELRDLIWSSEDLYPKAFPGAKFRADKSTWYFPEGGTLWFTYLEHDRDVRRFQGQQYCWVGFDELTQHPTPYAWNYLRSRLRTTDDSLPLKMRATSNPGGPGHGWVKKMFIDPAPFNTTFPAQDEDGNIIMVDDNDTDFPEYMWGKPLFHRRFIPAKLSDNPSLAKGGQYKANLMSLPEHLRNQLLSGDWTMSDGAAFPEFSRSKHVIPQRDLPKSWKRFRSCDFGYSSASAVHWFAIEPITDILIVYRELYVSKKTAKELSEMVKELEANESISYGVLDSSCWHVRGHTGPTIAEEMIGAGTRWRPSDRSQNSRINGRNRLHELLKLDKDPDSPTFGRPGIEFMDNCRKIIADLEVIPTDPDGTDDIDDDYKEDHAYDSVRYGIMTRPKSSSPWVEMEKIKTQTARYVPMDKTFGY